jgi:hypothetical protein
MLASDDSGRLINQVRPELYPTQAVKSTLTRAQVKAELATAIRTGNMPANDDSGLNLNQVHPNFYPAM